MQYDPNTNLPALNPGWAWNVRPMTDNSGFVVELRRTTVSGNLGLELESDMEIIWHGQTAYVKPQHLVTENDIQKAAESILQSRIVNEGNVRLGEEARKKFVGVYPPKRLGG